MKIFSNLSKVATKLESLIIKISIRSDHENIVAFLAVTVFFLENLILKV